MDTTEVTNQQFREFVDATGYVTTAERAPELRSIQPESELAKLQILPEMNKPGSICSDLKIEATSLPSTFIALRMRWV